MADLVEIELPSGRKVYAVASGKGGDYRPMGGKTYVTRKMTELSAELQETVEVLASSLEALGPRRPDKVELELSVEIGSGGALKILAAEAKGGIKVSLTWQNQPSPKAD